MTIGFKGGEEEIPSRERGKENKKGKLTHGDKQKKFWERSPN